MTRDNSGSIFLGLMSGTSMDGIDAALVSFDDGGCRLIATHQHDYDPELRADLLSAIGNPAGLTVDLTGHLDRRVGDAFAEAALSVLKKSNLERSAVTAIGSHGQTLRHRPDDAIPFTLQIGDPNVIAARTGIETIADFRRMDMALGGQGAPLAPAFHHWLMTDKPMAVVNVGGIGNVTIPGMADEWPIGFDTGPGNTLMDTWIRQHQGQNCDVDGQWAASGVADNALLENLLADAYFAAPPPKSTGPEYFNIEWLTSHQRVTGLAPADVQATLAELTARSVAAAVEQYGPGCETVAVCGGGVHNSYLMSRLASVLGSRTVDTTAVLGIDPDWMEAAAFGWLAMQRILNQPGNLPSVTGASGFAVLGARYSVPG